MDLSKSKICGGKPPGNTVANSEHLDTSVREFAKACENGRKCLENRGFSAGLRSGRNGLESDGRDLLESTAGSGFSP